MDSGQNPNPYPYPHHDPPNFPPIPPPHHHPYPYAPPPQPHWPPPPPPSHHHHHQLPPPMHHQYHGPPVDPIPRPPYPQTSHQYSYLPSSNPLPPPPQTSAYPAPPPPPMSSQGWGSPSWATYQGWENPERNIPYNNEEDLAARARAWAASQSASTNHLMYSQVTPVARAEEQNISVHGQYQSSADLHKEQPSFSQSSNQHLPYLVDQQKQTNHYNGTAPYTPSSASFGAGGPRGYDARDNGVTAQVSSPAKSFASNSSVYEQEVPYSYSLPQGHREAGGHSDSFHQPTPLPAFPVQDGLAQSHSTSTDRHLSTESRYSGHPNTYVSDAANKPLDFERPASEFEHHVKNNYGFADPAGSIGVMNHNAIAAPANSWTPSSAPGSFPQAVVSSGTQFDLPFPSQSSLPVQHPPAFGGLSGPSFMPGIPPVTAPATPFGLATGATLSQSSGYPADPNGVFSLPERPKKAAVPKWLQEEIIKNKSVIANTLSSHHNGSSYNSAEPEDSDKVYRRDDLDERKSFDSTKSSKDEEDDEDEVEAARSAAVNQEIKRVLTEVLMKVTDQLFNEIATKVMNEDDPIVEVNVQNDPGNHKLHLPPASAPKVSAKAIVPVKENDDIGNSRPKSPGGDILGLGSYASDEEDDEREEHNSKLLTTSMIVQQHKGTMDKTEAEKADKTDTGNHNGMLHDVEDERKSKGETAFKESTVMTKVTGSSLQNVPTNDREKDIRDLPEIGNKHTLTGIHAMDVASQNEHRSKGTSGDAKDRKFESHSVDSSRVSSSSKHMETRITDEDSNRKMVDGREKPGSNETANHENRNKMKVQKSGGFEAEDKITKHAKAHKLDSGKGEDSAKHEKTESVKDRKERRKEDSPRKRQKETDEKEQRSRRTNDSGRYSSSRRSPSPSSRGRTSKGSSTHGHGSVSSDEPSENTKRRKLHSRRSSSPSPARERSRHVSRSPNRKHSHRRHSPYSSADKRRRSRSGSPAHRRR